MEDNQQTAPEAATAGITIAPDPVATATADAAPAAPVMAEQTPNQEMHIGAGEASEPAQAGAGIEVGEERKEIPKSPVKITISLPTNAYFTSGIRDFCVTISRNMAGFSEQWAYRFQSVVDELINNAIEFGSSPGEDIFITFISMEREYIEVFVEDSGTGQGGKSADEIVSFIEEQKKVDPNTMTSIRGRGLAQIVSKWADNLEFTKNEKGGLTVHVIKKFQEDEPMVIPV